MADMHSFKKSQAFIYYDGFTYNTLGFILQSTLHKVTM